MTAAPDSFSQFGANPAKPLGPGASSLPPARRAQVNGAVASFLDSELGNQVSLAVGAKLDPLKKNQLTRALNTSIRAGVGVSLGIGGGIGASSSGSVVAGGGISLGASLGTRASAGARIGADVAFGTSLSGGFGVGAQAGLGIAASAGLSYQAAAALKASIGASLDAAMLGLGLSQSERAALRLEVNGAIGSAVDGSFQSAFGPELGYPNAAGVALLASEVTMQDHGEWVANCTIDHDGNAGAPTGPFVVNMDGVEWRGTVVPDRSGTWGGTQKVYVVGGAGGLDLELEPRNYAGGVTTIGTVVRDILRDSGETLSSEADSSILGKRLAGWQRVRGPARAGLDLVLAHAEATWRVLRDGTVWVGQDQWPEVEPAGVILDTDWSDGVITVRPDFPTLVPGIIVRGQRVSQVVYRMDRRGLRCDLHAQSTRALVRRFLDRTEKATEYTKRYRCRVVRQGGDTVDVQVDDPRMKGRGVSKCRIRVGLPGTRVEVPAGARCLVGWDDGDPTLPYVSDWESGTAFTSIDIG